MLVLLSIPFQRASLSSGQNLIFEYMSRINILERRQV